MLGQAVPTKSHSEQLNLLPVYVADSFSPAAEAVVAEGECLDTLRSLPNGFAQLIITSPPYNIGKVYEKAVKLEAYLQAMSPIIADLLADWGQGPAKAWTQTF